MNLDLLANMLLRVATLLIVAIKSIMLSQEDPMPALYCFLNVVFAYPFGLLRCICLGQSRERIVLGPQTKMESILRFIRRRACLDSISPSFLCFAGRIRVENSI